MAEQAGRRRRGVRGLAGSILVVLLALGLIGYGGYEIWLQHSGIAATVHLTQCWSPRSHGGGSGDQTCDAVWQNGDGTNQ